MEIICWIELKLAYISIHQGFYGNEVLTFFKAIKTDAAAIIWPGKYTEALVR